MKIILTLISIACFFFGFKAFGSLRGTALGLGFLGAIILAATRRKRRAKSLDRIQFTSGQITVTAPRLRTASRKPDFEPVGNVDTICPHCNQGLEKKPGRKKKCPHCGHFIYVRTQPSDEQQVLVTEAQGEEIEEQWSTVNETPDAYLAEKRRNRRNVSVESQVTSNLREGEVLGFVGSQEMIEAIKQGLVTGTSYRQLEGEGRSTIRLAVRYLNGEKLERSYLIKCPAITKENAPKFKRQF